MALDPPGLALSNGIRVIDLIALHTTCRAKLDILDSRPPTAVMGR